MKKSKCEHDDILPQAYFTWSTKDGIGYIPYLVLMCVDCDEYFIETGKPMQKEEE